MSPYTDIPEITPSELRERLDSGEAPVILDVREPGEYAQSNLGGLLIPLGQLPERVGELEAHQNEPIVVVCRSGARSGRAVQYLQRIGFKTPLNLKGGLMAWRDQIDPDLSVA